MSAAVELEVGLHRKDATTWSVDLRCAFPDHDAEMRVERSGAALDLEELRHEILDDERYGRMLGQSLFGIPEVREKLASARAAAAAKNLPLRVRLFIGTSAPELHEVRWEAICSPDTGQPLLTTEAIQFSRYLSSADWRPVSVGSQARLRALVVVANGDDVTSYQPGGRPLAPIDVEGEMSRAREAMPNVRVTELGSTTPATLANIRSSLSDDYDILYLVCHGFLHDGQPQLLLEDEAGKVDRVPGADLVQTMTEVRVRPRLVVLASCQSAGTAGESTSADNGALAALGPRLSEAGIAAVVAMQGNVSMTTVAQFMPVFFRELDRDGQIDRAMSAARGAVRERPDWWAPVLFMRLKSGRIWYRSGFADAKFEKWPSLVEKIAGGGCTPVLGPGLTDAILGSRRDLAWRWAREFQFPMAPYQQDDLPRVAQYLSVNQDRQFTRDRLRKCLREELRAVCEDGSGKVDANGSIHRLMASVVERIDDDDPHKILARLPFPMYVTTQPLDLMAAALRAAGKSPRVEVCRWNDGIRWPPATYETAGDGMDPSYRPDANQPFVFHLFGHIEEPRSIVLTEDDYFDYLIGVASDDNAIPAFVDRALADTSLLFLGFRMEDWDFRVLFRSIMNQAGGRMEDISHVAAQLDPEQSHTLEPARARSYLERYFQQARVDIYWGSADDFARDLQEWWEKEVG